VACASQHEPRPGMFPGVYASTSHVHACSLACTSARGSCTHVLRRASQHETVHTCSLACKPAQGSCTHVLRRARQHKTRARMFSGVHASTRLVHACSPACTPAQDSCTHVLRRARQHEARARMFSGVHVSTRHMHACRAVCWRACLRSPHAGSSSDTQTSVCGKGTR